MSAQRPLLTARGEEQLFYDHLRRHTLVYQRCGDCGSVVFPLRTLCQRCGGESLELAESAGTGTVYSCTTQYRPAHPFFADSVPYTLALVDLNEGFRVLARLVGYELGYAPIGRRVVAGFDEVEGGLVLLRFEPAESEESP